MSIHLVLFAGCVSDVYNYPRYQADLVALMSAFRVDASRTTVLFAGGGGAFPLGSSTITAGAGTKANLLNTLSVIAVSALPSDVFVFAASNHGGPGDPTQRTSNLWCWKEEQISSTEFAAAVSGIAAASHVYIMGQCYSGGFITSLAGPGRAIMTACMYNEVSYATADGQHDEFLYRLTQSLHSSTLRAAFDSAVSSDTQPEHPQLSDPSKILDSPALLQGLLSTSNTNTVHISQGDSSMPVASTTTTLADQIAFLKLCATTGVDSAVAQFGDLVTAGEAAALKTLSQPEMLAFYDIQLKIAQARIGGNTNMVGWICVNNLC